jgi:hypothetical protein
MHGLCYDLFYILMPYGGLMDQWNVYVMFVCMYVCELYLWIKAGHSER